MSHSLLWQLTVSSVCSLKGSRAADMWMTVKFYFWIPDVHCGAETADVQGFQFFQTKIVAMHFYLLRGVQPVPGVHFFWPQNLLCEEDSIPWYIFDIKSDMVSASKVYQSSLFRGHGSPGTDSS